MPLIDMSLEQLKEYRGRNPKPDDFEEYWDTAIEEMKATDPNVEIIKNSLETPIVDCYNMYFDGVRNGRIHAKLLKPKNIKEKAPAILFFHGYSGSSDDFMSYLNYAASGYIVAAMDCRGQAGRSTDMNPISGNTYRGHIIRGLDDSDSANMYFRNVFLDTAMLARIVMDMEDVDEKRVAAQGVSQGGALTVACAALTPELKLAITHFPFLSDYKRVWEMDLTDKVYVEIKTYFRDYDPMHEREEEIFKKLGYIDIQHLASRIKAEVMFFTGLMDDACPPSTQFAVYNKIKSKKSMLIYPDFGHEILKDSSDKVGEKIFKSL